MKFQPERNLNPLAGKIYITLLIYLKERQETVFDQFEALAIPLIQKHNGKLLHRVRPDEKSFIEHHMEKPYEIHFVEFDSREDFEHFRNDDDRKQFLHLSEQSFRTALMYQGQLL